jgi:tRNA nucleotidyltransferase/poly(A) polymerase
LPATGDPLELIRATLADQPAWLVGGAVRDRLLGRQTQDFDVVLDGDPRTAARAIAGAAGRSAAGRATAFALSEEYGGWRVVARDGSWQIDVERLRGVSLEEDLALRDFTVNAIAEQLGEPGAGVGVGTGSGTGSAVIDPLGGVEDLAHRCLRAAGPGAFAQDSLRVLRLVRLAGELDFNPDASTRELAHAHAEGLGAVAGERVFM